jgi:hypothetical protein
MERLKSTLEIATNIAVLLVAIAALSTLAIILFLRPATPNLRPGLEKGKVFAQLPQVDYGSREETLLIVLNTNCSYCFESIPFYRKLSDAQPQGSKSLRIVALFPNGGEEVAKYLKENQLTVETVADVDLGVLGISGTPTMILVNSKGEVKNFWLGKLSDTESDEFFRSLTSENRRPQ